jgi:hypothetical protein
MKKNQLVTLAEQERMGVRRPAPSNYVPPARNNAPMQVLPPVQSTAYTIDVPPTATLHTETRSSKVDAAKGFLIETTWISLFFSLALVLTIRYLNDWPLLSAGMFIGTLLLFALLMFGTYVVHKLLSAEGVAFYGAFRMWNTIGDERRDRAAYYRAQSELRLANPKDGE